jgi:CPA2 family monovalent cation:H+ antiporter-2
VLVAVISDPAATRRIIEIARRLNPTLCIIARTRFVQEMKHLYELGANEVIPEEFETSVEIFTRVLVKYLISADEIE